jgi:hypothetical protein
MGWVGKDLSGSPCQGLEQGYGPFDYRKYVNARPGIETPLRIVERVHFTPKVESLASGSTSSMGPEGDLDYTLRACPNHHRALRSVIEWATTGIDGTSRQPPLKTPPECYLQRAMAYQPQDPSIPLLYGIYLHRLNRYEQAKAMYEQALRLQPNSSEAHYNLGLLLTDMEDYGSARKHADLAYRAGYPLPGLRNRLEQVGAAP